MTPLVQVVIRDEPMILTNYLVEQLNTLVLQPLMELRNINLTILSLVIVMIDVILGEAAYRYVCGPGSMQGSESLTDPIPHSAIAPFHRWPPCFNAGICKGDYYVTVSLAYSLTPHDLLRSCEDGASLRRDYRRSWYIWH